MSNINFTWTPLNGAFSYTIDGVTYPPSHQIDGISRSSDSRYAEFTTKANTLLTFTASSTDISLLKEYIWNMGDGTVLYGPIVKHTYKAAMPELQVILNATDIKNREYIRSKLLHLVP